MTASHEPQYPAARVWCRSDDVRRVSVDSQHLPALSRNPSGDSQHLSTLSRNPSGDSNSHTARRSVLPIPEYRPRSVGAAAPRPPSVNHAVQPAFARNFLTQRSETPQTTIDTPLALGQTLPLNSQRCSGTPQPFVGPTHANSRPTGTVVVMLYLFHILISNQEPDF